MFSIKNIPFIGFLIRFMLEDKRIVPMETIIHPITKFVKRTMIFKQLDITFILAKTFYTN